ncbi:MerR family transcriptional regulator [Rhizobium phaseoli]|uniref:MerR family transcriptional regulator n=1 Tax=Rhizobium phaseoli TaxID=396 RepID=UPI001485BD0E|nr:MerR family transcriptional regulator [Rhizobium phaseoli]
MNKVPGKINHLKISELSRLTGVPVSTLRLWGEHGLLVPEFTSKGYRLYSEHHIREATDIKRLRAIQGLSLAAIRASMLEKADHEDTTRIIATASPLLEDENSLGDRLRQLRLDAKLTIKDVAERTGVKKSRLASMERTSLGMKIPEIQMLAKFYGVTLTTLMAEKLEADHREVVTKAGAGEILPTLGKGLRIEQLGTGRDMMDCQRWFIEPGVSSHGSYSHEGEELILVLIGEFEITIEETRVHRLSQGDSIYFNSNWKHSWKNPGRTTAVLMWVNTPPTF